MSYQTSPSGINRVPTDRRDTLAPGPGDDSMRQPAESDSQQQLALDLNFRLQQSLELEWVIAQFMQQIHGHLPFDGFHYQLGRLDLVLTEGRQQGHECSYRLNLESEELGQLVVYRGRKFSESELVMLESLLCSLLFPLRNSIEYRKATLSAYRDALTGVNNRALLDSTLAREISLAERNDLSFSVLLVDIDHFKKVNDTFGHRAGDEVIRKVALRIQQSVRSTDQVFRFGGEEFVVLLNDADCEIACVIADRVLHNIAARAVDYRGSAIGVSASIGLACLQQDDDTERLFNRADRALYAAKNAGRNQVMVASTSSR